MSRSFKFFVFLSCPSVHLVDLEWCEKSEETQDPQIELLETTSTQETFQPFGALSSQRLHGASGVSWACEPGRLSLYL